ncbi:MAG: GNAT family N-acetyltransferase [Candidatus Eisenbacteria bacterium]
MKVIVRAPRRDEIPRVWEMLLALARYERLEPEVSGSAESLAAHLFAGQPVVECRVAELGQRLIGYALFFPTYSSFRTVPEMWLEDLFVEPTERGSGAGRALLAEVARIALERGFGRLAWEVLDWNAPAIGFYERLGARHANPGWLMYAMDADGMRKLAAGAG